MLAQKLLKKYDSSLKRTVSDLFPDRALAAVKIVQSQEQNLKHTWVQSTHVEMVDESTSHVTSAPCAELGFLEVFVLLFFAFYSFSDETNFLWTIKLKLQDEHFVQATHLPKETK
jgi:hypothetical protein